MPPPATTPHPTWRHSAAVTSGTRSAPRTSKPAWPAPRGYEDEEFVAYGLTDVDTATLRLWARDWFDDLARRLHEHPTDD